jgi:hypothetical protein
MIASAATSMEEPSVELVVRLLRARGRAARRTAVFVLLLIIGALSAGLSLFVYAGQITRFDVTGFRWTSRIEEPAQNVLNSGKPNTRYKAACRGALAAREPDHA